MRIEPFGVEMWMNEYETRCAYNLAETCVESLTVAQLLDIVGAREVFSDDLLSMHLTYGAIEGSQRLRTAIAALYSRQGPADVLVTHGAIGANALVHQALVEPGDRVVALVPTYQQHYSIPASIGADVRLLRLREENGFLPDLDELRALVGTHAKLIAFSNPNNPTGSLMDEAMLGQITEIARQSGAYILADEVYRGLNQQGSGTTASIADIYEAGISTGSMSKAFSLAGLRLGWLVAPAEVIAAVSVHRDYNTISVGMIDDYFASLALEAKDAILTRNREIVRGNLAILDEWVTAHPLVHYVKPRSGTTALLGYDLDVPSRQLCVELVEQTGVMLTPGSALDIEGYLRIGYANNPKILIEGLGRMGDFLTAHARH
ncbi:MAG: aminotransferase [Actinobacteria bacterium]|nr:aminotransferase [Actinomycetota bacterium]MCB9429364.1 aminotransferase [Actinomycetota bacterium]MCO5300119.1 aminotransferase [Candidatus Nanopelagicales bacterium]HPE11708.1 aminotransferase [Actinomycetota bacterium]HRV65556.1 aminotransferase [Candidatus Nanopelagicales bacterium]